MNITGSDFVRRYFNYLTLHRTADAFSENQSENLLLFGDLEKVTTSLILNETINRLSIGISRVCEKRYKKALTEPKAVQKTEGGDPLKPLVSVKFIKDVESIMSTLLKTKREIISKGTSTTLNQEIDNYIQESHKEYQMICEYIDNILIYDQLCEKLRQSKNEKKARMRQLNDEISNIETKICDCEVQNRLKYDLVKKWEQTRHEQAQTILQNEETKLIITIKDYKDQTEQESVAIENIEKFLQVKMIELESMTEYWIEKHKTDIIELNGQIKENKEFIAEIQSKIDEIRSKYNIQLAFIEEYRREQKIIEEKKQFEATQRNAAIRIQSWWRGVMVRKQLGPYRPKKKGKKGKGKK